MIETLINFFKQPASLTKGETPDSLCPNCWGQQEYDNTIRKMYIDKQIDVNNHEANYSFIQDFVINRINGIKLIKGPVSSSCLMCGLKVANK